MRHYEAMFIFRCDLTEEQQKTLVDQLESILKENKSQIENSQRMGRRALAYEIDKQTEGIYYLMNFSTPEIATTAKLKRGCQINEQVLRVLVVKKEVANG